MPHQHELANNDTASAARQYHTSTQSTKMVIKCHRGAAIASYWSEVEPIIARAAARSGGQMTANSVEKMLLDGRAQLWFGIGLDWMVVAVTAVLIYPEGRSVALLLVGGRSMRLWRRHLEETLMMFGAQNNCISIEACVRPGFVGAVYRPKHNSLQGCEIVSTMIRKAIPPNFAGRLRNRSQPQLATWDH
jgi:hypothetical protein